MKHKNWQAKKVDDLIRSGHAHDDSYAHSCGMDTKQFRAFVKWRQSVLHVDAPTLASVIASCPADRKTQDGKPTTDYLSQALGRDVTAAERDAALQEDPLT